MDAFILAPDELIARRIHSGLERLGIVGLPAESLAVELNEAVHRHAEFLEPRQFLVLLGSARFGNDELRAIRDLLMLGGERVKIVAVGPLVPPETLLEAIRAGATDYLDISTSFDEQLHRLVDRLRKSRVAVPSTATINMVVSPCGGSGASFLAVNLAVALASLEKSCCLLDMKLRGGDLATMLKCTSPHTLLSLASKADSLDRTMFEQSLVKHASGVQLLCSPEVFESERAVEGALISRITDLAQEAFPQVVLDLDDLQAPGIIHSLTRSGHVLIPFRPDFISLYRAKKYLDFLVDAHVAKERVLMVANRTGEPRELPLERIEEILDTQVAACIPDDPNTVNTSINLGVPVVQDNPRAKVSRCIIQLAETLVSMGKSHPRVPAPKRKTSFFQTIARIVGTEAE